MNKAFAVPTVDVRKRIPVSVIRAVASQIAKEFKPKKIILFGSYARGKPRPESDLDLLVVMDTPLKEWQQSLQIRRSLGVMFGMDLIVRTPKRLAQRVKMGDSFLQDILKEGKVLYESRMNGYQKPKATLPQQVVNCVHAQNQIMMQFVFTANNVQKNTSKQFYRQTINIFQRSIFFWSFWQ